MIIVAAQGIQHPVTSRQEIFWADFVLRVRFF